MKARIMIIIYIIAKILIKARENAAFEDHEYIAIFLADFKYSLAIK